jgi:hypothetical protein
MQFPSIWFPTKKSFFSSWEQSKQWEYNETIDEFNCKNISQKKQENAARLEKFQFDPLYFVVIKKILVVLAIGEKIGLNNV